MTHRSIAPFARFWPFGRREQVQVESPFKVLLNEIRYSNDTRTMRLSIDAKLARPSARWSG
jgi:hypothetical protein